MSTPSVTDVMTTPMLTLAADTPIDEAARAMGEADIKSLVIVGEGCQPDGIFTSTDALEVLADGEVPADATVDEYMTTPVKTISPETTLTDAAERMQNYSHLPVTDADGDAVGILTKTDLAAAVADSDTEITTVGDDE
ncbi:CBS domain-containing protein [Halonotius terrestris]|uniref:CBS domain-containing protein n=1 Tax=Halonotius terrestris TaxID=2487750 RepID=A0A8J8P9E1_9EURY|nr:CBS domain-containing protein [Halonotius terrestris]TQQ80926.1 CBS domain-containing protein [Halonotius terrestris]